MTPTAQLDFPTAAEVTEIVNLSDAALRNVWITWTYHRLKQAMRTLTGDSDLNWCAFAVYASKTAGAYIRQEEVGLLAEEWVDQALCRLKEKHPLAHAFSGLELPVRGPLLTFALKVLAEVGAAIGLGNREILREIGPPFCDLFSLWTLHRGAIPEEVQKTFLDSIAAPAGSAEGDYLRRAFATFLEMLRAPSPRTRAQLMLAANTLIGCAEQIRVQPYIAQAMTIPVAALFRNDCAQTLRRLLPDHGALLDVVLQPLGEALEDEFVRISTAWTMRMYLPDATLHLGSDVPPLAGGAMYPELLASLDAPQPLELFEQFQAVEALGCAAKNWVDFEQRMRYVAVLFRSRQQDQNLWAAPYAESQVAQLKQGRLPDPPL